jgi:hypothetical protein
MSYTIDRLEQRQNRQGKDETFFSITITDELGVYPFGKWLSDEQHTYYITDPESIDTIIETYLPLAKTTKIAQDSYVTPEYEDLPEENL